MPTPFDYLDALEALEKPDGVIAFPTDTVYGLGCLPDNPAAVEKIYNLKGRTTQKPLILMSHEAEHLLPFIGEMTLKQSAAFQSLAKNHWPGPLTIIVPKSPDTLGALSLGRITIGLRIPESASLNELLNLLPQKTLATTSANLSNQLECSRASEVFECFGTKLDYILMDERTTPSGKASTVVEVTQDGILTVLRQGSIVLD